MKKSVIAMLTGAMVVGTTATTFAAANPFSDVPAGHWAYNAVTKLAAEGVIEGYGDGTFRGNRNITRYEMAQMVARALAKNPQGSARGDLDKLAAEFRDELDSLGVRVAELEKHADKVKWTGELRYRYWNNKTHDESRTTRNRLEVRLFPTAEINDHWSAKARFTAYDDMDKDTTTGVELTYMFAEGKYKNFTVSLGRMPLVSKADQSVDGSMLLDNFFSGAQIVVGSKFKGYLEAGRWRNTNVFNNPADYLGVDLVYNNSRLNIGAGYRHFKSSGGFKKPGYGYDEKANIVSVGAGYKFGSFKLSAAYAKNNKANMFNKSYNFELAYKGANRNNPGSWGALVSYRYIGQNVSFAPTYDSNAMISNKKGVDFGVTWSPLKNTFTKVSYFHGKDLDTNNTTRTFFGRVSFFF